MRENRINNNTYFEEPEGIGVEWTEKHEAHKAGKREIIDIFNRVFEIAAGVSWK